MMPNHHQLQAKHRYHRCLVLATALFSCWQFNAMPVAAAVQFDNQAVYTYIEQATGRIFGGLSPASLPVTPTALIDPLGQVLGCDGNGLPDYRGFSVALYEPDASGVLPGTLLTLTPTELPDSPGNQVSGGKAPNIGNINPFPLTNAETGTYNFLFDPDRPLVSSVNAGLRQAEVGSQYILVLNPPPESGFPERRILLTILSSTGGQASTLRYQADALDGVPIGTTGGTQVSETLVEVRDAETQGLNLSSLSLGMVACQTDQIRITKSADRGAAQPGDTAVYRLTIENLAEVAIDDVVVTDHLPQGFRLIPEATQGAIATQPIPITTDVSRNGLEITFSTSSPIPAGESMDIIYGVQITPDALRGDGRNSAAIRAGRSDNDLALQDGPVSHLMRLDPGILSDSGTLIGRVFIDTNLDGEQQPGEAGVPNAVIFLDDGNRIVTDEHGRFSVAHVLAGRRTGALDLSSLPGYTLAPNHHFKERNSQSRLVNLAPGGLARMNFAVMPAVLEEGAQ